jgi:nicotinamidase/pyrazinamidase
MKSRAIFVEVDVQNDFISGSLAVNQVYNEGRLENMLELSQKAPVLVGSVDSHDHLAWEFSTNENKGPNGEKPNFPPHCVVGTDGWLRPHAAERPDAVYIPNAALLTSDMDRWLERLDEGTTFFFMKEVYSMFANPNAKLFLNLISRGVADTDQLVIYGIATDYCVDAAAVRAREEGYEVHVVTDAIAAVDPTSEEKFRNKWLELGIKLITTKEVLDIFETKEKSV